LKYDKDIIEKEAILSVSQGSITNKLGKFILQRSLEIAGHSFVTNGNNELKQALIDDAVMRVCEKFLLYYQEDKCAANLIISMIYSTMTNKIVSLNWRDIYGQKIKGIVMVVENGYSKRQLVRYLKDDYISKKL
jgi:hypothetical protein|tara:strand:+ start:274 stop:675 length:402 start_codon:yes stop_codon:yes gene_type:complete